MSWIQKAFYGSVSVLCITLAVCAIFISRDFHRTAVSAQESLSNTAAIAKSANDVLQATYASEGEIANLADTLNDISADLRKHEDAQLEETQKASAQLTTLFIHADTAVQGIGDVVKTTNTAVANIGTDVHATLGASQETLKAATADLSDPALKNSLAKIGEASDNVAVATKEAQGAMTDVHTATTYEVKQLMAPVSKTKTAVLFVARVLGNFFHF